jgi:hypothetical protein
MSTEYADGTVHQIFRKVQVGQLLANGEEATKESFEKYSVFRLDGEAAVKNDPAEYSWKPWPQSKPDQIVDHSPPVLEIKLELLPLIAPITLVVSEAGPKRYCVKLGDENGPELLKSARLPLFEGARKLLEQGWPAEAALSFRWAGSATISMSSTIGRAAELTVRDNDRGMRLARHEEFKGLAPCTGAAQDGQVGASR